MARAFLLYLALLTVTAAPFAHGHDWLRRMESNTWTVVPDRPDEPNYLKQYSFERFTVRDEDGQYYVLFLPPEQEAAANLAAHELAEVVGVPHVPIWPTVVRRGENGIPPGDHPEQDRWQLALLSPFIAQKPLLVTAPARDQALKCFFNLIFTQAVGARNLQYIVVARESYFAWAWGIFEHSLDVDLASFKRLAAKGLPWEMIKSLEREDAEWFIAQVGALFDRLEAISSGSVRDMFDGILRLEERPLRQRRFDGNTVRQAVSSWNKLRLVTQQYLRERIGGHFRSATLNKAELPIESLLVQKKGDPDWKNRRIFEDPSLLRKTARHHLEAFFLTERKLRNSLMEEWSQDLQGRDPIKELLEIARKWDGSVRITNTRGVSPAGDKNQAPSFEQSFLNQEMPKTVFVYGANDAEGRAIEAILQELSSRLPIVLHRFDQTRGATLQEKDLAEIKRLASDSESKQIAIIECGGILSKEREVLESAGFAVIQFDHHQSGERSQWGRYSALEQLADYLGYQLSADQRVVALMDRAGPLGLLNLGWSRGQLERYLAPRVGTLKLNELRTALHGLYDAQVDVVAHITDFDGSLGALGAALALEAYNREQVAVIERRTSVMFLGRPELVHSIMDATKSRQRRVIIGGDYSANLFSIIRPRQNAKVGDLAKDLLEALGKTPLLNNPCIVQILGHSLR